MTQIVGAEVSHRVRPGTGFVLSSTRHPESPGSAGNLQLADKGK